MTGLWLTALAIALIATPATAVAHVRWFIEPGQHPPEWSRLLTLPTALVVVSVGAFYLAFSLLQRLLGRHFPNPKMLAHMEPAATTLLAVQTGISLVYFASQRQLFVPNLTLPPNLLGWGLVAGQLVVAFTFITGLFDRAGALLLVAVYLLGFLVFGPQAALEQTLYAGIGLTLAVLGRTIPPAAVARRLLFLGRYEREAVAALRILTGFSVLLVAFTEKLLAPEAGLAFVADHPEFNVPLRILGWSWFTDEHFVLAAGVTEATIGALLMAGVLTRVVILGMWVPFNVGVAFLPPIELLGHLPIFGIMYVLLLYGSGVPPAASERSLTPALTGELRKRERQVSGETAAW